MSSSRWGSDTWADNENWDSDQWSWKEWTTKDWSDSIYGPSHTWTTKGWHDNGSRRQRGIEANEELWKVTESTDEFNAHAGHWAGRDPDGSLPNAVDDTSSMHVNTEGQEEQEEQNDTRSRGSQSRGEEQPRTAAEFQNEQLPRGFRLGLPPSSQLYRPEWKNGWTLEYFENFTEYAESYMVHNDMLKFVRDYLEACNADPARMLEYGFPPFFQDKVLVPVVKHDHKSPKYEFDWDEAPRKWHWHQMVAMLNPESMRYVVEGDQQNGARSRGLVSCGLIQLNRYDHKRHSQNPGREGPDLKVWDFVLFRTDGSCIALHPEHSSTKFGCTNGMPVTDLEIPTHGRGGSDGSGTFSYFKKKQVTKGLKFDGSKKAPAPAPQSRPTPPPAKTTMPGPPAPQSRPAPPPATTMPGPPAPPPPGPPVSTLQNPPAPPRAPPPAPQPKQDPQVRSPVPPVPPVPPVAPVQSPLSVPKSAQPVAPVQSPLSVPKRKPPPPPTPPTQNDDVAVVEEPSPGITRSREEDNAHRVSSSKVTWNATLEEVTHFDPQDRQCFEIGDTRWPLHMAALPQSPGTIADSEMASPAAFAEANPESYQRLSVPPVPQANPASDAKDKRTSVADTYLRNVNARGCQ
jgi:hypothetical protein